MVALLTLFLFAFALWQAQAMIYLLIQFQHGTLTLPCNYLSCLLIMSFPTTFILLILYAWDLTQDLVTYITGAWEKKKNSLVNEEEFLKIR